MSRNLLVLVLFLLTACGSTPPSEPYGSRVPINSEEIQKTLQKSIKNPEIELPEKFIKKSNIHFESDEEAEVSSSTP